MKAEIAVIIINYCTASLVIQCLNSLEKELGADDRVILLDNASPDDSFSEIKREVAQRDWPWLELIESPDNLGFSGGNNLGIQHIDAEYYLLLNSDTIVKPGALKLMSAAARGNPDAGLISPRLLNEDASPQTSCFRYASPLYELLHAAATGPVTKLLNRYNVPLPHAEHGLKAEWLSFACVLIPKKVVDTVGPLDSGYFMYYEDMDFGRRVRRAGWSTLYVQEAEVIHLNGASSGLKDSKTQRKRLPRYLYASRSRYYAKFYGRFGLLAANGCWTIGWLICLLHERIRSRPTHRIPGAARDIWTNFLYPLTSKHPRSS